MDPRRYALIAAIIFAVIAVLQLARAVLGWPVAATTPWGILMIPRGLTGSRVRGAKVGAVRRWRSDA